MRVAIREMRPADYNEMLSVWESTPGMKLEKADSKEGITRYLEKNPKLSYVAHVGSKIMGTVLCGQDGRRGYIQHLCVLPEYRARGVGAKLLEVVVEQFSQLALHEIRIFVFKDNDLGNDYWGKSGWLIRDDIYVRAYEID